MLDEDTDDLLIYLILIGGAIAGGPSVLAFVGVDVGAWMVSRGVLLGPSEAMFVLPLVDAGPDWRRLVLVILVALTMVVLLLLHSARRRGQGQS